MEGPSHRSFSPTIEHCSVTNPVLIFKASRRKCFRGSAHFTSTSVLHLNNRAEFSSLRRCYLTRSPASVALEDKQPCSMHRAHAPAYSFECSPQAHIDIDTERVVPRNLHTLFERHRPLTDSPQQSVKHALTTCLPNQKTSRSVTDKSSYHVAPLQQSCAVHTHIPSAPTSTNPQQATTHPRKCPACNRKVASLHQ